MYRTNHRNSARKLWILKINSTMMGQLIAALSTRAFETWTAIGSELVSLLICLHTTTFTLRSMFCPLELISMKIWETPLSWHGLCSLQVAVRVSKSRVLIKLPIVFLVDVKKTAKLLRQSNLMHVHVCFLFISVRTDHCIHNRRQG